ncbi:MAG TPA: MarR family transcriptional regulator [bacterium]|nr:MarR family transcriptional regulator [bacterium]
MPTRYKGRARDVRALDVFIKLMRASETLTARLNRGLAGTDVTPGQLSVLEALLHVGPMSQSELGKKLLRSNANMTTVLDNLERDGLIRRERESDDRRVVTVSLTADGKRRIEKVFPAHAARIAESLAALSASEQEKLGELCKKLGCAIAGQEE